ncbi:MAG: EF-hand domain-containing protein [Armatimonadota bacterium]
MDKINAGFKIFDVWNPKSKLKSIPLGGGKNIDISKLKAETKAKLAGLFNYFDQNNNAKIDKGEWKNFLQLALKNNPTLTEEKINRLNKKYEVIMNSIHNLTSRTDDVRKKAAAKLIHLAKKDKSVIIILKKELNRKPVTPAQVKKLHKAVNPGSVPSTVSYEQLAEITNEGLQRQKQAVKWILKNI